MATLYLGRFAELKNGIGVEFGAEMIILRGTARDKYSGTVTK